MWVFTTDYSLLFNILFVIQCLNELLIILRTYCDYLIVSIFEKLLILLDNSVFNFKWNNDQQVLL